MLYILLLTVLIIIYLSYEALSLKAARKKIDIRILVNGTRGKSSVTEYITAVLAGCGIKTIGKITGVVPALITQGTSKNALKRSGRARVQEQVRTLFKAADTGCNAAVFECMSISPELQCLETRILDPYIYIITNVRSDHLEVMGFTLEQRIKSYCDPIKPGMKVITADKENSAMIKAEVEKRNAEFHLIEQDFSDISGSIKSELLPENILAAVKACQLCGIEPDRSIEILNQIDKEKDKHSLLIDGKEIVFINKFSMNDTESADKFMSGLKVERSEDLIFIFNTRADRPLRTQLFSSWFASQRSIKRIYVSGSHIPAAVRLLKKSGIGKEKLSVIRKYSDPVKKILDGTECSSVIIGIGNIAGDGFRIIESFSKLAGSKS